MQSQTDGEFKWILVYQDHLTKFVQLRATKSKRAAEVAHHLLDIFCIFGAPAILQRTPSWFKVLAVRSYIRSVYEDWFENFKHTYRDPFWFDSEEDLDAAVKSTTTQ